MHRLVAGGVPSERQPLRVSPELRTLIPAAMACRYKIVPLARKGARLQIALADPGDIALLDEIRWLLGTDLEAVQAEPAQIDEGLRSLYGLGAETVDRLMEERGDGGVALVVSSASDLDKEGDDASVIRFVNELLLEAFRERATDIHLEPFAAQLRIRYRIDGILYDIPVPESLQRLHAAIVSRIKIMANLNIAEQRLPQDGRIKVRTGNRELDLRISILPTPFGETVNLRILNSQQVTLGLENLGLLPRDLARLERLLQKPHGIILVTGPTGSGKTTTLYACLNKLNESSRKIITVEDPIEYQLAGISQVQVNPKIGLTFAQGLRSLLRHDPDVMLVGEIRDHETAEVTIQVAMTGHLVFSTLHTNDAPGAVARLANMGIEPYLIAASVECIIAQRLVRVICPECKSVEVGHNGKSGLVRRLIPHDALLYHGRGCSHCKQTGYWGRTAIYEFLLIDDELREHIVKKTPANQLRQIAINKGMITLRQDGLEKIRLGLTTLDEVLRVTQEAGD
ncbi:MAG: GspE/PulE family protein [candidate division KSB1 bacterium]|nr:GspE/PulE family protein [candidate division KSB1 bacterium]MDZ7300446.1 GspE/PulE family protein [candidate division KSB1 bacterium]MDZ7309337.1 GspE/PulE family protein [candidate division KSB1 bacterium]MDZ7351452.1 GspE/PulE family protein [candidate division KSB1 bacterium]MDZ7355811.1 GspE/PulE family protein [candidate division KSB1 bacterium]